MLHLYTIAHNLAAQVETIHQWGNTVIGDLNFLNVLVLPDMRVTIVDFDSVQYTNGRVYPCKVGMPEFTPPEGFGANGAITSSARSLRACSSHLSVAAHGRLSVPSKDDSPNRETTSRPIPQR